MPRSIVEQLAGVRRKLTKLVWLRGALSLALAVMGIVMFAGMTDWLLHVSGGMRLLFLLALAGTAAWLAYHYWLLPLRVPVSDLHLALRVERAHPELAERLSSTIGFLAQPNDDPLAGSRALRERVMAEAVSSVQQVEFGSIVRTEAVRRTALWTAGTGLLALILVGASPRNAAIALERLARPFDGPDWPKQTQFRVVEAPKSVAIGDPFSVDVKVIGVVPPRAQVLYRLSESEHVAPEPLRLVQDNLLRGGFEPVTRDFEFAIVGGDGRTEWFPVEAVPAPEVESIRVAIEYPAYTGLPREEYPPGRGHVRAVVGSRVTVWARSNKPLVAAELYWEKGAPTPAQMGPDSRELAATFAVTADEEYRVVLRDEKGMTNANRFPRRFRVQAVADQAPEVAVEQPASDIEVTREAVIALRALAKDDFGLASMALVHARELSAGDAETGASKSDEGKEDSTPLPNQAGAVGGPTEAPRSEARVALMAEAEGPKRHLAEYSWALAPMKLPEGAVLRFHVEAADLRDDPGPNIGKSRETRVRIVSKEQFLATVDREQGLLREEVERVLKLQEAALRQVSDLEQEAKAKGTLNNEQKARLQSAEMTQRRVREKINESDQSLDKQVAHMLQSLADNKIDELDVSKQLVMMRSELARVAEQHLPPIARSLTAARKAGGAEGVAEAKEGEGAETGGSSGKRANLSSESDPNAKADNPLPKDSPRDRGKSPAGNEAERKPEERATAGEPKAPDTGAGEAAAELDRARSHQQEVVSALTQMLEQLDKWETVAQVVNDARELERRQKEVTGRVEKLAAETLGKETEGLSPEQMAELGKAADRQEQAREQLQRMQRKMSRIAQSMDKEDPAASETLRAALEQAQESNIGGKMADAARDVKENRLGDAARSQKQVESSLRDLVESLENRREQELARLAKQLRLAEADLEKLLEEQRGLLQKTKEADKIADPKARAEELRRLRKRQRELKQKTEEFARRLSRLRAQEASQRSGRAAGRMDRADQGLDKGAGEEAGREQAEAEQELEEAMDQLAQTRRQVEQELAEEQLAKISDSIRQIHQREVGVVEEIGRLEGLRAKNGRLTRGEIQSVTALARAQKGLAGESRGLVEKLSAAKVFVDVIEQAAARMDDVAAALGKRETGDQAKENADQAAHLFALLLDALQPDRGQGKKKGQGGEEGGQEGGGGGGGGDGIPNIAQIKLLKLLQTQLKSRTVALGKTRPADGKWTAEQEKEIERLGERQGKLADMVRDLSREAPQAEPVMEPEEERIDRGNEEPKEVPVPEEVPQ